MSVLRVEVINTGSELLLGHVINRHLGFLAEELFPLGLRIGRQACVPDGEPIREALAEAMSRSDVVLVTGGLGPTTDDLTREVAAELLGCPLKLDSEVLDAIRQRFVRRGFQLSERVQRQAMVPAGAEVLPNSNGTAPGLYFPAGPNAPHLFLLPGPPRELHPMVREQVLPRLRLLRGEGGAPECRVFRITGMGESQVEAAVGAELAGRNDLELGYCARPGEVDVRLIGVPAVLDSAECVILKHLGSCVYSVDGSDLEAVLVRLLAGRGETLAVAESCTGGFLAHRITNVPGASAVFLCGFTTYSNAAKTSVLGVPPEWISAHGAVSAEVAEAMAAGALRTAGSDHALSLTGVAGPDGGTGDKPVGTVFIGLASKSSGRPEVTRHFFPSDRQTFKAMAAQMAMEQLRQRLV